MLLRRYAAHGRRSPTYGASLMGALALVGTASFGLTSAPLAVGGPVDRPLALHSCVVDKHAARCGTAMVPEDRLTGRGREIPIRVVVFPASGPGRLADPIVWVAGGPGDSAVDWIPRVEPL
ncbi:MAG TPA: hypothetical protein VED59_09650, partial [Acidimicrobiales bacterium]|nr:hypothetical protein [Acidimicrobiales bacterium]